MSDSESESTDSDNNNGVSHFFNHYLGGDRMAPFFDYDNIRDYYYEDSSSDDMLGEIESGSSSSEGEVVLHNTSDESDSQSDTSSHSSRSSSLFVPYVRIGGQTSKQINITATKQNSWCIPKELYKREIGHYDKPAKWNNKFYQSEVAVQKLKLSRQLIKGHEGCVNSLDFNNNGDLLVSGSDDCRICLWDWSRGVYKLKYNSPHTKNIFQTKFLTTQDVRIVSTGRDGFILLSAVNNSDVIYSKIVAHHDHQCNKLGVHHEVPFVVLSCGEDGIIKNIDIRESPINENERITNILHIKNAHGDNMKIYGIDINPMNPFEFIMHGNDEGIRMYDKRRMSNGPIKIFQRCYPPDGLFGQDDNDATRQRPTGYKSVITSAVYNYSGTEILGSYSEDDIYLFDVNGSAESFIHRYGGHTNNKTIKGVNFYGPRSEYVISGSDCGYLFIWDKKTEAIVQRKHADSKGAVNVVEGHPHMPTIATSGLDSTVKIWEPLNKGQPQKRKKLQMSILKNRLEQNDSYERDHFRILNGPRGTRNNHHVLRYF